MDESVLKTIINAFLAVNDPYSSVATRNEANGYIEKFKIRNDSISYLNYILTLYMNTNTNANATNYFSVEFVHVIKYFALTLLDSVSWLW